MRRKNCSMGRKLQYEFYELQYEQIYRINAYLGACAYIRRCAYIRILAHVLIFGTFVIFDVQTQNSHIGAPTLRLYANSAYFEYKRTNSYFCGVWVTFTVTCYFLLLSAWIGKLRNIYINDLICGNDDTENRIHLCKVETI